MGKVFTLNSLEELQLWLESLAVYFQHAGKPVASKESIPSQHNFRPELKNTLIALRDEAKRCPLILHEELEIELAYLDTANASERDLKRIVRDHEHLSEYLSVFVDFWEFLNQYNVLGLSLGRHQNLSQAEFRSYGSVLTAESRKFLDSKGFLHLLKKRCKFDFREIIDNDILPSVKVQQTREELEFVFNCFFDVLSIVQYCQEQMQESFKHQKLTILLTYTYHSYQKFLKMLEKAVLHLRRSQPALSESMESIKFGLKLELRHIFDQELKDISSQQELKDLYSNMESAVGLLKHASRQAFTSLVLELNPDFDELTIFQELKDQQTASKQLLKDVKELYRLAKDPESQHSEESFGELVRVLQEFRRGSMKVLFFKDWQPFEQFNRELETAELRERAFILHRLEVYLSTLIGEIERLAIRYRDTHFLEEIG